MHGAMRKYIKEGEKNDIVGKGRYEAENREH